MVMGPKKKIPCLEFFAKYSVSFQFNSDVSIESVTISNGAIEGNAKSNCGQKQRMIRPALSEYDVARHISVAVALALT